MEKEIKYFIKIINELDEKYPENKEKRSRKGKKYLSIKEVYMNNTNLDVINEFDNVSKSDIKKEFKSKYGIDITKELNSEEFKWGRDFEYHGKYRNKWKMFTYIDENNVLTARCPVLGLDVPDSHTGHKKDIDLIIEHLEAIIDDYVGYLKKENRGKCFSPLLERTIRV